ncbi:MAG: lamin tail domain-containing protein [Bacteroidales bacterium]|nr:lamin tail domain-containing protein [Bacteroidales bacterium]
MKKIMTLFVFFVPFCTYSQFQDDFNDGLFYNRPTDPPTVQWEGDVSEFIVNNSYQLQLNSSAEKSPVHLRTFSERTGNTSWSFYARMDFTPSASNYTKVYLMSDREDLTDELNGIFVRIGYTDKNICLIQSQAGKNNKTLIKGEVKRLDLSSVKVNIKVTLDHSGTFHLYSRLEGEDEFLLEGSCHLPGPFSSQWFGIVCNFTTTRSQSFYFDDFLVESLGEEEKPIVSPLANEILINEILFNPNPGGNEYVEIVNPSNKEFDLCSISITSRKPSDGSFNKIYPLSVDSNKLNPGQYLVISKSKELVCNFYSCSETALYSEPENMPPLSNTTGCVVLYNNHTGEVIDEFYYNESMHSSGIKNKKGVALERISLEEPTNERKNWASASGLSGYGTPGSINSQQKDPTGENSIQPSKNEFVIEYPAVENESYQIKYKLDKSGYTSKILIFDIRGRRVDQIINNEILNSEGSIAWNKKKSFQSGIYIVYIEIFDLSGSVQTFKLPLVIN